MKNFLLLIYRWFLTLFNIVPYYLLGRRSCNVQKIKQLKNSCSGKRCFIVCNGPSLRPEDLDKIHKNGDLSIGINIIARIYPKTKWRPDFLFLTEDGAYKKKNAIVRNCEAGLKIFWDINYLRSLRFKGNKVFVKIKNSRSLLDNPKFTEDVTDFYYSIACTTYETFEWARHIGCSEIYLIGCDMSYAVNLNRDGSIYYNNSGQNHFYGKDMDTQSHIKPNPTWEMIVAFEFAEEYSKEHGFRIYNATRGGALEAFERVDFDSLFK